jgi:DNA-binding MarR family transcriptional regulator
MNKTVQLVNEWARFEGNHPDAGIEDFCRYYLIKSREAQQNQEIRAGIVPPDIDNYLLKLLGSIFNIGEFYMRQAMRNIKEINITGFYYLNSIKWMGECRKTDVINHHLSELSSGIDHLNRLLKEKLIEERPDPEDGRARLVRITEKGETLLFKLYDILSIGSEILFLDLSVEDKKLIIQILKGIEPKHAKLALESRHTSLEDIKKELLENKKKQT